MITLFFKTVSFVFFFLIVTLATPSISLKAEAPESVADISLALSNLAVPEEIGKVQERFTGNGSRTIIQIQDVHAHATAQQNIAVILERLRVVFGIETAALEGAWTSTSLPKSHAIPTSREKQLLAGTLLADDRMSGPAYAAIMSPRPITLIGMEEEASYEKNRSLFLAHLERSKEIAERLRTFETTLKASQKLTWGSELSVFGSAFGTFRETSDLGKFFPLLWNAAEAQQVATSDLPQIVLIHDIMSLEKLFEKKRLEQEVKRLMREYKNTPWTLEELIRGGKIPQEKLGFYPELKRLTRLYQMRDQVSLLDLTTQIEALTSRILEKLVRTPDENALWEKTERFYLARRILLLQASPSDIRALNEEKAALTIELGSADLAEPLSLSLEFYEAVKQRDEIFFYKIMNDPSLAGNIAIVTGGFHTDGLSERFRAAGISYITIAPDLGGTPMNEKLYNERMTESQETGKGKRETLSLNVPRSTFPASPDGQTLSELRNAIARIDDRFSAGYKVLLQTRDVRKAVKAFLGEPVAVSKSDELTHLYREKRIASTPKTGTTLPASELRLNEFMATSRSAQLEVVRGWLTQGRERRGKAMLVSSVRILSRIVLEEKAEKLLKQAVNNGDVIVLAQDVPVAEMPEVLSSAREIERFEAQDVATLIEKTPRFQRLAKKRPFAIMENGYPGGAYVVLPERSISLVLFRIVTLNPSLYQAAKDPAFLSLLEDLVSEILSQELPKKAA
ncbi:MAG: hypothetical protein V1882_11235 [Candidatus Omnitrophota bacterium]